MLSWHDFTVGFTENAEQKMLKVFAAEQPLCKKEFFSFLGGHLLYLLSRTCTRRSGLEISIDRAVKKTLDNRSLQYCVFVSGVVLAWLFQKIKILCSKSKSAGGKYFRFAFHYLLAVTDFG